MNTLPNPPPISHDRLSAEMRLAANRSRIQRLLAAQNQPKKNDSPSTSRLGEFGALTSLVEPAASELVRRYPVRSLAAGALVGALLVGMKPWRGLLGSLLGAGIMRQASAASIQWVADKAASLSSTPE